MSFQILEVAVKLGRLVAQFDTVDRFVAALVVPVHRHIRVVGHASVRRQVQLRGHGLQAAQQFRYVLAKFTDRVPSKKPLT